MERKFKIGDRVVYIGTEWEKCTNKHGKVVGYNNSRLDMQVQIDKDIIGGHWNLDTTNLVKESEYMDTRKNVELTLPNGAKISGTPQQITAIAASLGIDQSDSKVWYKSNHLGKVMISTLTTEHLINAIKKICREHYTITMASVTSHTSTSLINALTPTHSSFQPLVEELKRRS